MPRNLFLYLTIACFLGLIAVFIVDGYLGIHETITITAGEREEKIGPDFWQRQEKFGVRGVGVNQGEKTFFRYEVDNRRFTGYQADIEVSVWHSQEKIRDLVSQSISIGAFDTGELEWVVDTEELLSGDVPPERSYQYTIIIKRGETERKIIIYVNPAAYPQKPVPIPAR